MSSSSETIFDTLKKVPNDQYSCTQCDSVPEITNIDSVLGTVEINCPSHGKKELKIKEYFEGELKYLYYSYKCNFTNIPQSNFLNKQNYYIFNCCPKGDKNEIYCQSCTHLGKNNNLIKVNELNCTCKKHFNKYTKYCIECKKHFCEDKECKCGHLGNGNNVIKIESAANENLNTIKEKKKNLELIIKLLNTIIETYEKHPSNYFNTLNINNLAKANIGHKRSIKNEKSDDIMDIVAIKSEKILKEQIEKYESILKGERDKQVYYKELFQKSLKKTEKLEKQILEVVNKRLSVKLVGNEIKIDLNNKNVGTIDLKLLSLVPFNNLEEMNLSHNNLQDLAPIENLQAPKLKKLDLGYSAINDITALKKLVEKQKEKAPAKQIEINLDGNKLLSEQVDEIKALLSEGVSKIVIYKECNLVYEIDNSNNKEIRILGQNFVNNNKNYCKIKDGNNQKDITEFYKISQSNKKYTLNLTLIIKDDIKDIRGMFSECKYLKCVSKFDLNSLKITNISDLFSECSSLTLLPSSMSEWDTSNVTDMSGLFYRCSKLESIPDISNWDTSNVKNMMSIFNGCSSLKKLPDISKWNVINANNISCMFVSCSSLTEIPKGISQWKTMNVTNMGDMFNGCSKITDLSELTKWNTSSVTSMKEMFKGCKSLTKRPNIKEWDMSKVTNEKNMFDNCP